MLYNHLVAYDPRISETVRNSYLCCHGNEFVKFEVLFRKKIACFSSYVANRVGYLTTNDLQVLIFLPAVLFCTICDLVCLSVVLGYCALIGHLCWLPSSRVHTQFVCVLIIWKLS